MRHPAEIDLALFAGGDLTGWRCWRTARHVRGCSRCSAQMAAFRDASDTMRQAAAQLPPGLDWDRLAAEMTANIHVGLAAGECVAQASAHQERIGWKAALVLAGVTVLLVGGWLWNLPGRNPATRHMEAGVVLETTPLGIQLSENGSLLTLRHGSEKGVTLTVSGADALRARYVDAETGQVTINHVYAE